MSPFEITEATRWADLAEGLPTDAREAMAELSRRQRVWNERARRRAQRQRVWNGQARARKARAYCDQPHPGSDAEADAWHTAYHSR